MPFSGRIGQVPLAPDSYKAVIVAINVGGRSNQVTLLFAVVK